MIAGAEMRGDDQLILEFVTTVNKVVEVHVAELVDFFFTVIGRDKSHLADLDLGLVHFGTVVEASRGRIAGVGNERRAMFGRNFGASNS